ncbi:serine/threonine-protein kinase [Nocardia terpenica]|uniref:non-specific serine/threonine protein kinase n=1 Tax=Nocardia terpenica TaxID=455432 RepID=A0A6G9Z1E6_9NOCA|nr:serine/threonine-protein kinase [Nocardia terpenica]QIS19439.1 protein kinase [Nocardia terpenica]
MRVGQLVAGRYRLQEQVGAGAHGSVWRADDEELGRVVALKYALPSGDDSGGERIPALKREAKLLAQLNHPNILTVFDVVRADGQWWLVMEYVPGSSLRELGVLPPRRAAAIGAQVAGALEAVHRAGIVHRDIKPGNVLVAADDRAKLADFGISRAVYTDETLSSTGTFAGTLGYMAPETAAGKAPSASSDVFSLGATLFAAVEGRSPFGEAASPVAMLRRTANTEVAAPRNAAELTPALSAMLRTNPAKRPAAHQVREMLENVATHPPPSRIRRTAWVRLAIAALVLIVVAAWAAVQWTHGHSPTTPAPGTVVGDPHTADPCALADPHALAEFDRDTEKDPDAGNFNRCDLIAHPGGGKVDVMITLENPTPGPPTGPVERIGTVGVLRVTPSADECRRTILLPDHYQIDVDAHAIRDGRFDLCGIADAAATPVVRTVSRGPLPRRGSPPPANSLFGADACGLLGREAISEYPGVDATHPTAGFGRWDCRWTSTVTPGSVLVRFDRNPPLTAADGQPVTLAGRDAFVQPNGYGNSDCTVRIVYRSYTTETSTQAEELVLVVLSGPQPPQQRCQLATGLAESVAAHLPPS